MKPLILSCVTVVITMLLSGCTQESTNDQSQHDALGNRPNDTSISDSTAESTPKDPSTNFLGGKGALEIIDKRNALFLQDDEWYYIGSFKMKKESVSMGKMISQCREAGCQHSNSECILNQYHYGRNMLLSDGRDLYLVSDNTLLSIDSKGNTDTLLQFKTSPNGISLEEGTFQFSELQRIDETHIYVEAEAYATSEAYVRFYSICDLSDGSIKHIKSEIMPGVICTDSVTGQCYCISSDGEIIRLNPEEMLEEIVTEQLDDFPTWDGWTVHDNVLYYINRMGQYCQYDLNLRKKTLLYDISPFEAYILHDDMIYTLDEGGTKILRGNYAWTEYEEVYAADSMIRSIVAVNDEVLFFSQDDGGRLLFLENGKVMQYAVED